MFTQSYLYLAKPWPLVRLETPGQYSVSTLLPSAKTCTNRSGCGPAITRAATSTGCCRRPEKSGGTNPVWIMPELESSCTRAMALRATNTGFTTTTRSRCATEAPSCASPSTPARTSLPWRPARRRMCGNDGDFRISTRPSYSIRYSVSSIFGSGTTL